MQTENADDLAAITSEDMRFAARVFRHPELDTTVIQLTYTDPDDPRRHLTVAIAPDLGSNMFRYRVGEHELIYCEPALLKRMAFTGNFVLWPLPNRVRDKRYSYQGQSYSLEGIERLVGDDLCVHGLVFDRPWQYDLPTLIPDGVAVTTYVEVTPSSPHYDAFPFESRLALTYSLTREGISIAYEVHNRGAGALPYGFALHPYFATLSGPDETRVSIPASAVMEADDALLPTGRMLAVDGIMYAMFDLREPVPVGRLKLDHIYTRLNAGADATIEYPQQGLRLRLSATDEFTHMVIYTLGDGPYLCLENQTCSTDAHNLHSRGLADLAHLLELPPGETRGGEIRYNIEQL